MDCPQFLATAIIFLATFIQSTFGFGAALVAMPLLTFVVGIQVATPLVGLIGITIGLLILRGSWRNVDFGATWRLIVASAVGVPLGLIILKVAPAEFVKMLLGSLVILFGLYRLIHPRLFFLHQQTWAYLFGFVAGVLGGAYNTPGPPVVIYGALRRWSPVDFRATLQGFFLPTGLLVITGHGLSGLWTAQVFQFYVVTVPFAVIGIYLGGILNRRFSPERFERILYVILILLGVALFL